MEDFLKMDIFFVVATACVFAVGLFILVILYYVIRILQSVDHISENVSRESDTLRDDVAVLRKKITDEGLRLKHFSEFFEQVVWKRVASRQKKHKSGEVDS